MHQAFQIAPGLIYKAEKPVRNPRYKRFVKRFPCIGCGRTWLIDPMHTGPHSLGEKSCDMRVLPGCRKCHREFDANPKAFASKRGLDIPALIAKFNHLWETRQRRIA